MNELQNIDREIDDLELVSDRDKRRLYELDAIEAIKRVSLKSYAKDELVHYSYSLSADVLDDIADIRRNTGLSETKIYRGLNALGASIIQHNYDKCANEFDDLAGKLNRIKGMPYIKTIASQASDTPLVHVTTYPVKKNTRFIKWSSAYLRSFGEKMLINNSDMIRIAFCFSLNTWSDVINGDVYEKEIINFDDFVMNKLLVFKIIYDGYKEAQK